MTLTIIGYGNVGRALSLVLLGSNYEFRLNIMDPDPNKREVFLDLKHGIMAQPKKRLCFNDTELLEESDFIFFTAGAPTKHGASRLTTAKVNTDLVFEIFRPLQLKSDARIIAITNPVDIVTSAIIKATNLPESQVIGTGTFLDSLRLQHHLSELGNVDPKQVHALVLGEHGGSQVPVISNCRYQDQPLDREIFAKKIIEKAVYATKHAVFEIRKTEYGTSMAVVQCALRVMEYWLSEEETVIPVCIKLDEPCKEWLGMNRDLCMILPVKISKKGVFPLCPVNLSSEEFDQLKHSAKVLSEYEVL